MVKKGNFSARIAKRTVEPSQFDLDYQQRHTIEGHILADFVAEFSPLVAPPSPELDEQLAPPADQEIAARDEETRRFYLDGSASSKGSGAGVILFPPQGHMLEQAIRLGFSASNNVAEYEALLANTARWTQF